MGIEVVLGIIGAGLTAISVGTGIYSAVQSNSQAKEAANMESANAQIAAQETSNAVAAKTEEMTRLKEAQKMAMLKSGMNLAGSNLLVLENTKRQLSISVNQLQQRQAVTDLNSQYKENSMLQNGRSAMIGGVVNAVSTVGNYVLNSQKQSSWNGTNQSIKGTPTGVSASIVE